MNKLPKIACIIGLSMLLVQCSKDDMVNWIKTHCEFATTAGQIAQVAIKLFGIRDDYTFEQVVGIVKKVCDNVNAERANTEPPAGSRYRAPTTLRFKIEGVTISGTDCQRAPKAQACKR